MYEPRRKQKTTVEIRKDILKEVRVYCVRNSYTVKVFVNVALETLLKIGMPQRDDEHNFPQFV